MLTLSRAAVAALAAFTAATAPSIAASSKGSTSLAAPTGLTVVQTASGCQRLDGVAATTCLTDFKAGRHYGVSWQWSAAPCATGTRCYSNFKHIIFRLSARPSLAGWEGQPPLLAGRGRFVPLDPARVRPGTCFTVLADVMKTQRDLRVLASGGRTALHADSAPYCGAR